VVTPPAPPPTDAGMTNTMPSATDPNWVTQANGLKIWDVVSGSGTPIATGDVGRVFYTGWLAASGAQFDSGRPPENPFQFTLGPTGTPTAPSVIVGWQQGLVGLRPGGIRRLYIPSALGYGPNGNPPTIPGDADLIFEVKLISHT
jgi:FKBP-type peptidyl-prolyl cis-trans isomerase